MSELYNSIWERCEADDEKTKEVIDKIRECLKKEVGKLKKKDDIHAGHSFDENWCYNCQRCVDEESEEWQNVGNGIYNKALEDVIKIIEVI